MRRSVTSVEKSTSSTVHVFFDRCLIHLEEHRMLRHGRRVKSKPESRIIVSPCYSHASRTPGFSREQATALACSLLGNVAPIALAIFEAGRRTKDSKSS